MQSGQSAPGKVIHRTNWYAEVRSQVVIVFDYLAIVARFYTHYSHKSIGLQLTNGYYVRVLVYC